MIGAIIGIFLFVTALAVAILAVYFFNGRLVGARGRTDVRVKRPLAGWICTATCVLCVLLFIFVPFSFHTVQAGQVAVVKHLGKADKVRVAGTYYDFWVTETYDVYDAKVQTLDISDMAYSKDAQSMDFNMTVQYKIDTSKLIEIATTYGSLDSLSNRIRSVAQDKTKSVFAAYSAMNIIETRASISPEVEQSVKTAIDSNYYVIINTVVLTNIDFSDAFEKTVEDKMIAEQEKLKAEYEKETAIVNAEKELEVAKLQAEARIATATAEAQSSILVAKAEAESIKAKSIEVARALGFKINETVVEDDDVTAIEYSIDFEGKTVEEISLITEYLKYVEYLAKWNGELPGVLVTDGSAQVIIPTT